MYIYIYIYIERETYIYIYNVYIDNSMLHYNSIVDQI